MMRKFLIISSFVFLMSCDRHPIELVKSDYSETEEVKDHSPVYFLLNITDTDTILDVNRKNTIGTTNWIFHVDKRTPLKLAIPKIHELQEKKKNSMHTNDSARNYFSYTDSIQKSLAFVDFNDVVLSYNKYHASEYIRSNADYHKDFHLINVDFYKTNSVKVNGFSFNFNEVKEHLQELIEFDANNRRSLIYLNINQNLLFSDYLQLYLVLKSLKTELIMFSDTHFVYDASKLDCDC